MKDKVKRTKENKTKQKVKDITKRTKNVWQMFVSGEGVKYHVLYAIPKKIIMKEVVKKII